MNEATGGAQPFGARDLAEAARDAILPTSPPTHPSDVILLSGLPSTLKDTLVVALGAALGFTTVDEGPEQKLAPHQEGLLWMDCTEEKTAHWKPAAIKKKQEFFKKLQQVVAFEGLGLVVLNELPEGMKIKGFAESCARRVFEGSVTVEEVGEGMDGEATREKVVVRLSPGKVLFVCMGNLGDEHMAREYGDETDANRASRSEGDWKRCKELCRDELLSSNIIALRSRASFPIALCPPPTREQLAALLQAETCKAFKVSLILKDDYKLWAAPPEIDPSLLAGAPWGFQARVGWRFLKDGVLRTTLLALLERGFGVAVERGVRAEETRLALMYQAKSGSVELFAVYTGEENQKAFLARVTLGTVSLPRAPIP